MITQIQALHLLRPDDAGYQARMVHWSVATRDEPLRDLFIGQGIDLHDNRTTRQLWFYREGPQAADNAARKTYITSDLDYFGTANLAAFVQRLIAFGWDGEIKEV